MESNLEKKTKQKNVDMELAELIKCHENSIIIACKYFKKSKDYTKLIEIIIIYMNKFAQQAQANNQSDFVNLYLDFKLVKIANMDYDFFKMLFPFLEEKYPKIIGSIVCVNTSVLFKVGYKIIKSFLSKDTRHKIIIQKKNDNGECINFTSDQIESGEIDDL